MSEGPVDRRPEGDVYTILVIIATILVFGATIYLGIRGQQLFGTWNPFSFAGA